MKRSRFSEEQIIGILRESVDPVTIREVCAKHNISEPTYYAWKAQVWRDRDKRGAAVAGLGDGEQPIKARGRGIIGEEPHSERGELKKW